MKRILIVEDDRAIAELERDYLEANDYEVEICEDGESGLKRALQEEFALILLDVMLPKEDGFQVCRNLRASKNVPIILVSAKREDMDKIRGLGLGANDYIVKPFNPSELIARVKSQIANYERLTQGAQKKENLLQIENLMIDLNSHEVFLDGESLVLPNKEFELLVFLAKNPNIVFSKDQLFEKIWGLDAIGEISTVTVHINRIREKIEKDSANRMGKRLSFPQILNAHERIIKAKLVMQKKNRDIQSYCTHNRRIPFFLHSNMTDISVYIPPFHNTSYFVCQFIQIHFPS